MRVPPARFQPVRGFTAGMLPLAALVFGQAQRPVLAPACLSVRMAFVLTYQPNDPRSLELTMR